MAQCPRCKTLTAYIDRHLQTCDSEQSSRRTATSVLAGKDLRQARLSHLVAIPGMLLVLDATPVWWIFVLTPFNVMAP